MFMSPFNTLKSWGSSSSRDLRSTWPSGVTRPSSGRAHTSDLVSSPGRIVRNLYMVKGVPPKSV